ncbi:universal stress protein [Sulfitobacter guttiformis]|uniref:Nucleotide-binding universal stress UspA family protein n=1 Tax=Sulfitobacter guttiformis TaxID=74349 RepID=A0A420DQ79_9RHOB|nr:universal stress protein [Sulfitobacter guttiformis]KIN73791.1 Universal stress family protein [Sulfitobacter guttiformis KCTC 32187]RKE96425.1 nucleotide-binding universal stress UspA family protein [Sulfitobacter guttiformis]
MITSIIVGIDGSDASDRALRLACCISLKFDATLAIMHTPRDETVVYAADAISGFYVGANIAQQELLREAAEKLGEQALATAASEGVSKVEMHIGHGDPAHDILDHAEAVGADLIITGRRGLGDLGSFVLGSTSHQISKKAKCACLTVP